jgi:hypothetical protein
VEIRQAAQVRLDGAQVPVQADGDAAACLPVEVGPAPRPMRIVVP